MIGAIIAVVIGILLLGIVFKLVKLAIIAALVVGAFVLLQSKFGRNGDSGRIE